MALVLFDGVCNLCNAAIQFIIRRDPREHFQFAALTSEAARRSLGTLPPATMPDSVILVDQGRVFTRSDAALHIVRRLTFPWFLGYGLIVLPRGLRDAVYDAVAQRRYRWFGRREACMVPSPSLRKRFLD